MKAAGEKERRLRRRASSEEQAATLRLESRAAVHSSGDWWDAGVDQETSDPQVTCMVRPADKRSLHGLGERYNLPNSG